MAVTNFSPLLGLALPTTGDLTGVWGTTVNDAITELLDDAVAGTTTLTTDADVTLTTTNGAVNQARNAIILCTGARTAIRTITAPAQSKLYVIVNATSGSFGVKIVGAGPTTGVTVLAGRKALVVWNGSDFVEVAGGKVDLTTDVVGVLPVVNGGTGISTTTAYSVVFTGTTATGIFQAGAGPGTSTHVLTSNGPGALPTFQAPATGGAALSNDTTTASNLFPMFASATSGTPTTVFTSNTKLLYKPSTGELQASEMVASNGIFVNNTTVSASYTVASGFNAMSVGPITVASGQSVTVTSGQRWVVI